MNKRYLVKGSTQDLIDDVKKDFPGWELHIDRDLKLYQKYITWIKQGRKTTSIRFEKGKIKWPISERLPFIQTNPKNHSCREQIGEIELSMIVIKPFGELTKRDAIKDGFRSKEELVTALKDIYGDIQDNELVSIYFLKKWIK